MGVNSGGRDWALALLAGIVLLPIVTDWKTKNAADTLVQSIK